ncbi:MAG: IclR family transcriptional regulator, partial [Pseudomonadota bacterium]
MTVTRGVLSRYATILDTLSAAPEGLTLTEIMQATALPRGTVHRLLGALLEVGYIAPVEGRKVYVLGSRLLHMLHLGTPAEVIVKLVRPILDRLVARFRETAFLAKLEGREVRSVAMAMPSGEGQSYVQPGREMPAHAAASGKAIFAFQDEAVIADMLARPMEKFTDKAITDPAAVRAELEGVRGNGYAVCDEELDPGIYSYACPVHLEDLGVIYSIGLVGLTERLHRFPA